MIRAELQPVTLSFANALNDLTLRPGKLRGIARRFARARLISFRRRALTPTRRMVRAQNYFSAAIV